MSETIDRLTGDVVDLLGGGFENFETRQSPMKGDYLREGIGEELVPLMLDLAIIHGVPDGDGVSYILTAHGRELYRNSLMAGINPS